MFNPVPGTVYDASEADKVRCGQRHLEALGMPFAIAVSADEV